MGFEHFATAYGYTGVFVLLALEYVILIVPGETLLTTVGVLSHTSQSSFNLPLLIVSASMGTFTGSILTYLIGRMVGRPVIQRFGKYIFISEKNLQKTERLFQKQATWTLLITKYIAVIRDIIPYVAGVNKLKLKIYIPIQLIASFLWTSTFLLGGNLLDQLGLSVYRHWRIELIPGILLLIGIVMCYRIIHKRLHRLGEPGDEDL
ncbi:DedA family protein [Alicyclobacillus fodiniaquatilis]|uniref:DedA family protein n=1 Tax=Alicyclobacillus fodiniaquatilis TaxID=1661150 RepID=A0ABW4JQ63_9BACL